MNKLLISALLVMMCGSMSAQEVPDTIIDGNKYANTKEWPEDGKLPQFRNGTADLLRYLHFNVKYPKEAKKHKVEGRVIVVFVVDTDGSIVHVHPVESLVHFLDKEKALKATGMSEEEMTNHFGNLFQDEAKRVLSTMPNWKPGIQFGRPVRVRFTIPVTFAKP